MPHSHPGGKDKIMFRRGLFPGTAGDCFDETVPSGDEPALPGKATLISSTAFSGIYSGFLLEPIGKRHSVQNAENVGPFRFPFMNPAIFGHHPEQE